VGSVDSRAAQLLAGGPRPKLLDVNQSPGAARGPPTPGRTTQSTDSTVEPDSLTRLFAPGKPTATNTGATANPNTSEQQPSFTQLLRPVPGKASPAAATSNADLLQGAAGLAKVPAQPDPGNGLSPPAAAFNARIDHNIKVFQDQTGIPMDKIGMPFEPSRRVALGLVDGALNAGYNGTTVAANPPAAAQASSSRWSSLLHGDPSTLAEDYWNHPGIALAQDTNTLRSTTLGRAASDAATQLIPGAASVMSNPVAAAWIGDTAGGMAHTALNVGKRYVPALAYTAANLATNGAAAAVTTALGIDPYAQIKHDYQRDLAGTLTEDTSAAMMFIPGLGEAGAAGTAARATGAAKAATTAETAGAADAATAATATKAAAGEANAATPQAAIPHGPPKPVVQEPEPAGTPTGPRSASGPLTSGVGTRAPAERAGNRPTGTRPDGRALGPRRSGGNKEMAPVGGGNDPLAGASAGRRPGSRPGVDSPPVADTLTPRSGAGSTATGGRDAAGTEPDVARGAPTRPDRLTPRASREPDNQPPADPLGVGPGTNESIGNGFANNDLPTQGHAGSELRSGAQASNDRLDALGDLTPSKHKLDPAAHLLAERIGGQPQVHFSKGPDPSREFDAVSEKYVAQSKPGGFQIGMKFRQQARATFEVAKTTGRQPYFHFEGAPGPGVINKLKEYGKRYGLDPIIDIKPLAGS